MTGPVAALLDDGRLHLQHGPIDLLIDAEGAREIAFEAARARFATILDELVAELSCITRDIPATPPKSPVARRMLDACCTHSGQHFVTPMAAVAGAVADEILAAMTAASSLRRAYVNNGGDIAIHLDEGHYRSAISTLDGTRLATVEIGPDDGIGGLATSGLGGRSLTLGIADQVTVLAANSAAADVAATLIANAVDLPGHPAITRAPAHRLEPFTDLGDRLVTTACGTLSDSDITTALTNGATVAEAMLSQGQIIAAFLHLRSYSRIVGLTGRILPSQSPVAMGVEHA